MPRHLLGKKKNTISYLIDDNGQRQDSPQEMATIINGYFSNLFKSGNPNNEAISEATKHISSSLSAEDIAVISKKFTKNEIKYAIFQIRPHKALGPDRFQPIFFQKSWDHIGNNISNLCLSILNEHKPIELFNHTDVFLIQKIPNLKTLRDFRPISLCPVIYKVVTKAITNHLKQILPILISENQSAFIANRQIHDNVISAFEILQTINSRKKGKKGYMTVKLDMAKPYDRVEWRFIEAVMTKMRFPYPWITLIMNCITTSNLSFILNGKQMDGVNPSRGLRQGCPLSPYLFLIYVETLSSSLKATENQPTPLGIKCSRTSPTVSHLLFEDDSILFGPAETQTCHQILHILRNYGKGSGQLVNLLKTSITLSPNTPSNTKPQSLSPLTFMVQAMINTWVFQLLLLEIEGRSSIKSRKEFGRGSVIGREYFSP